MQLGEGQEGEKSKQGDRGGARGSTATKEFINLTAKKDPKKTCGVGHTSGENKGVGGFGK